MAQSYLETIEEQLKPRSNYVRFQNNEKKTLIFKNDETGVQIVDDEKFGRRVRFTVTDVTDPIRPQENLLWDVSPRWSRMIISYIKRNQECLEITRQGMGTETQYIMMPANTD